MPFQSSLWVIPDAVLEGCETPVGAARRAHEMISRLPAVPNFVRWHHGARRVLTPCLYAAARHPDPQLRGNASVLLVWLSGSGRNLWVPAQTLRRISDGEARRAAAALNVIVRTAERERSAFCSLARSALLRNAVFAADDEAHPGSKAVDVDATEAGDDGRSS